MADPYTQDQIDAVMKASRVLAARYRRAIRHTHIDYDDLVNTAVVKCLEVLNSGGYDATKGDLSAYLWRCAQNDVATLYLQAVRPDRVPRRMLYSSIKQGKQYPQDIDASSLESNGLAAMEQVVELDQARRYLARKIPTARGRTREKLLDLEEELYGWK
jgi:hypothetical protein